MTDEDHDRNCERRERLVREICSLMGWPYRQSPIFTGLRKVALGEATVIGLDKLAEVIERLKVISTEAR